MVIVSRTVYSSFRSSADLQGPMARGRIELLLPSKERQTSPRQAKRKWKKRKGIRNSHFLHSGHVQLARPTRRIPPVTPCSNSCSLRLTKWQLLELEMEFESQAAAARVCMADSHSAMAG